MKKKNEKSIAAIHWQNSEILLQNLLEIQADESLRAAVLFFDFEKAENIEFTNELNEKIKNFPIPLIAAVTGNLPENASALIEKAHLCIAEKSENAVKAFEKGLINRIVSKNEVRRVAILLAEEISKLAPLAVRACLKAVNRGFEMNLEDGLTLESELFAAIFSTEDMREGTRAFLEKRPPAFRGK